MIISGILIDLKLISHESSFLKIKYNYSSGNPDYYYVLQN